MQFSILFLLLAPLAASFPLSLPALLSRALTDTTQNNLIDGTACKEITVLFARGTDSPGNVGSSTGPPWFQAIASLVGTSNIAVQGIAYPASIIGFLEGGDDAGSILLANYTARAMTQCPSTKVVMSGYSQGGQLVHKAAKMLSASVAAKVSSVLIFGDPLNGTAVAQIPSSKVKIYAEDAPAAAAFVVAAAGLRGRNERGKGRAELNRMGGSELNSSSDGRERIAPG
ncbi:Cutinase [Lachnellula suecica]|uniref:Cutinase n=1 Tax=Lachnellula suecica TaxID=602035 RepID=A0A8T9C9C9_9HELO|nr:Cutinase [Lachnellula suecica]